MNVTRANGTSMASPVVVLAALAQAAAYLCREGEYSVEESLQYLYECAERLRVLPEIADQIINEAFEDGPI